MGEQCDKVRCKSPKTRMTATGPSPAVISALALGLLYPGHPTLE